MGDQTSGGQRRRRGGAGGARPVAGQLRGGAPLAWKALYVPGGGAVVAAHKISAVVALGALVAVLEEGARCAPGSPVTRLETTWEGCSELCKCALRCKPPCGAARGTFYQ